MQPVFDSKGFFAGARRETGLGPSPRLSPRRGAGRRRPNLPNVVVSSHVAGVTQESVRAMAIPVTAEMLRMLRGEKPHVLGNPECWPRLGHLR